jgi:hypothetical protein
MCRRLSENKGHLGRQAGRPLATSGWAASKCTFGAARKHVSERPGAARGYQQVEAIVS